MTDSFQKDDGYFLRLFPPSIAESIIGGQGSVLIANPSTGKYILAPYPLAPSPNGAISKSFFCSVWRGGVFFLRGGFAPSLTPLWGRGNELVPDYNRLFIALAISCIS
jgi:hypothetical protein